MSRADKIEHQRKAVDYAHMLWLNASGRMSGKYEARLRAAQATLRTLEQSQ